jgi:hypothetical protein
MTRRSSAQIEEWLLSEVRAENLTWRWNGLRGTLVKVWESEYEGRPLTAAEHAALDRLIATGQVRRYNGGGYSGGRGGYEVRVT